MLLLKSHCHISANNQGGMDEWYSSRGWTILWSSFEARAAFALHVRCTSHAFRSYEVFRHPPLEFVKQLYVDDILLCFSCCQDQSSEIILTPNARQSVLRKVVRFYIFSHYAVLHDPPMTTSCNHSWFIEENPDLELLRKNDCLYFDWFLKLGFLQFPSRGMKSNLEWSEVELHYIGAACRD